MSNNADMNQAVLPITPGLQNWKNIANTEELE